MSPVPTFDQAATAAICNETKDTLHGAPTPFDGARAMTARLGARPTSTGAVFGFWTPELSEEEIPEDEVFLELLVPPQTVDLTRAAQEITFHRYLLPTARAEEYTWSVVHHAPVGSTEQLGALYRLVFADQAGTIRRIGDPLAASVPFGAGAPAELYDMERMLAARSDHGHFETVPTQPDPDGVPRITAPTTLLEVHVPTATAGGTIASLTRRYREAADALRSGSSVEDLPPSTQALLGYEAIQLMPIEPTILFERGEAYWNEAIEEPPPNAGGLPASDTVLTVTVQRPYSTNWGYDVTTSGSPAVNPVLLESGRPDEFLELIETLHTFPTGAIRIVLDVVYGHADNQALALLNRHFFAGANMYGQNLNYTHPVVRAMLLEMQRRKSDFGVDGVRVDGAQDFKYWVREEDRLYHDDDYLRLMNDVEQSVAGQRYRPWMIFEDGRPWPRDDWEIASSYREVTRKLPRVVQWGPLTFAHNTPFLFTFWISKWWRIRELLEVGANWITGNSNHDTLRRGTQVNPAALVNTYLGSTLPEIFENGYDNHATRLFDAFLPGIPMDFLNANLHGPWSFVRNTDFTWAIKVVSEESHFLDWAVTPKRFNRDWAFPRLKARGFHSFDGLRRFQTALAAAVSATRYDADALAALLNAVHPALEGPPQFTGSLLRTIAREWMDDVHEFCNLDHYRRRVDTTPSIAGGARFGRQVRAFRNRERWLAGNLHGTDHVAYQHPPEGSVLLYGYRSCPETVHTADGKLPLSTVAPDAQYREVVLLAHLEGAPRSIVPAAEIKLRFGMDHEGWHRILATPSLQDAGRNLSDEITLRNSTAILYGRAW
ncbi:MAG: glucosylglycerol hydrolase [Alkalispirochaeta sp.]